MTQPYLPPITGLSISGANLVATLADGTTSTMALPTTAVATATSASTSVTASTITSSYARPLSDFTGEIVHVVSFIPAGTVITAVTDWGPIWNAALAECRAIMAAGRQFRLVGPGISQTVSTTINMTDLGEGFGDTPFGSQVDFNNASILGQTGGAAIIDAMNTWFLRISNLSLTGSSASGKIPTVGFQHGRAVANSNADTLQFDNCFFTGWYSLAAYYNLASESLSFLSGWISNGCSAASATGVFSVGSNTYGVAPTPVSGAANTCYATILDGLNHWQVPTLSKYGSQSGQTPFPPETPVSFEQSTFVNVTFSNNNGPALWMSHCASPRFIRCYANSGGGQSLVDIYRIQNDDFVDADFDLHFETFGSTPTTCIFRLLGPAYQFNFMDGFAFRDSGAYATTSVFKLAGSQSAPTVYLQDIVLKVAKVVNGSTGTATATLFDTPASYTSNGSITCQSAVYNGVNHTGRLNLGGVISEVGNITFAGVVGPAAITQALAESGIMVVSDSVRSLTLTNGGNYYSQTTAFTPTVTFSAPATGTTATGVVSSLSVLGLGISAGGTGFTTASGLAGKDASGNALPWTFSITATSGVITAITASTPTSTIATIPAGPFTVVQSGGSGSSIYGVFGVSAVTISAGTGYQTSLAPVTAAFSTAYSAPAATATVNMQGSFNIAAGQKIGLDASGTMWVEEDANGKVVIGTGTTRLFSIDGSGNVLAKGTVTASTTV